MAKDSTGHIVMAKQITQLKADLAAAQDNYQTALDEWSDWIEKSKQWRIDFAKFGGHTAECVIVVWGLRVPDRSQPKCDCGWTELEKKL